MPEGHPGANEVQVGGLNTSDPRFAAYMSYGGCLSSKLFFFRAHLWTKYIRDMNDYVFNLLFSDVLLEVNTYSMKPLEEYMAFTKTGGTDVYVKNSLGVRSAQCAFFDAVNKPRAGPSLNISFVSQSVQSNKLFVNYYFTHFFLRCLCSLLRSSESFS